jgi:hypothetical protein
MGQQGVSQRAGLPRSQPRVGNIRSDSSAATSSCYALPRVRASCSVASDESFEDKEGDEDFGAGGIDGYFAKEVTEAARILSRLAWSPWLARIDLRWRLRELRTRTAKCDAPEVRRALRNAQHTYGELPGPLGELVTKT